MLWENMFGRFRVGEKATKNSTPVDLERNHFLFSESGGAGKLRDLGHGGHATHALKKNDHNTNTSTMSPLGVTPMMKYM